MNVYNAHRGAVGAIQSATQIAYLISREPKGSMEYYRLCNEYMKTLVRYLTHVKTMQFLGFTGKIKSLEDFPEAEVPADMLEFYKSRHDAVSDYFDPI